LPLCHVKLYTINSVYTYILKIKYFCIMNIQVILVIILFAAAILYIGKMMYKSIASKKSCGGNCKCGVDFSGIEPGKPNK
jgi:hypothetical protein